MRDEQIRGIKKIQFQGEEPILDLSNACGVLRCKIALVRSGTLATHRPCVSIVNILAIDQQIHEH